MSSAVDLSRELSTDLPVQAKLFSGAAAAQATITLAHRDPAGDPVKHGGWFYSGLNADSPLFSKQRKGAAATLEFGFVTAAGSAEYITVLVGTVRSLTVSAGGRQATMVVADRSETMRKQVQLPMVIADGEDTALAATTLKRPGLNTTWLADYVARRCGYNASPPQRSNCKFLATMHGSAYPEVGALRNVVGVNGEQPGFIPTPADATPARWVMAMATSASGNAICGYNLGGTSLPSVNNGSTMLVEGWYKLRGDTFSQPLWYVFPAGATGLYASLYWQQSSGRLSVLFNRGGGFQNAILGPVVAPGTSNWHYIAAHVSFASTGVTATFRYDSTTTGPTTTATGSITGQPVFAHIDVSHGRIDAFADARNSLWQENVQLTVEASAGTWNDDFTPTASIVPSSAIEQRLAATPNVTENGWELFQEIAQSEFATAGFTEEGMLFYWTRRRWTTAPYTTSQRTLTASTALKELATVEAVDQVRNRIIITARAPLVGESETVWKLGSRWMIPASSSLTRIISLQDPVGNVDTSVVYGTALGSSRYLASDVKDGQGAQVSNLTINLVVLSPTTIRVIINNALNAFPVYMAGDENASVTYAGKPYLWIDAQIVQFTDDLGSNNATRAEASDSTSITNYGEQILQVADNDFRQDDDDVQTLADDLLDDLADPGPAITDVPAVGDPRSAARRPRHHRRPRRSGHVRRFPPERGELLLLQRRPRNDTQPEEGLSSAASQQPPAWPSRYDGIASQTGQAGAVPPSCIGWRPDHSRRASRPRSRSTSPTRKSRVSTLTSIRSLGPTTLRP